MALRNSSRGGLRRAAGRIFEAFAAGEQRRQRGGVRAASAVRGGNVMALDRNLDVA
jgi:hypothetical protein